MNDPANANDSIVAQIEAIAADDPKRSAKTWRLLQACTDEADFAVGLDFAADCGAYETSLAAHLRGDTVAPATDFWVNPIDGTEFVWIPPGDFMCGRDEVRTVHADGFFLARYPITNSQFQKFLQESGYTDDGESDATLVDHWIGDRIPTGYEQHPVVFTSMSDALEYCHWSGACLPTEWMWEKAARGIDGRLYPWGDRSPVIENRWTETIDRIASIGVVGTTAVDLYSQNRSAYGCDDMVGNVSEWCWGMELSDDDLTIPLENSTELPTLELPPSSGLATASERRVWFSAVRGACFKRRVSIRTEASHRRRLGFFRRNDWVGFRPAFLPRRAQTR